MSELNIAHWARKRAAELINVDSSTFTPDTIYESSAATAFAQYIEEHEEAPLTPEQQAEIALEQALGFMHKDFEKQFWQGTYTYTATIMEKLEAAGFQIVKKETACD